jgi:hypothetical protein
VSQTKGSSDPNKAHDDEDGTGPDRVPHVHADAVLRDTQPGAPELDLSKTLPTGAAFHSTWRMQSLTPGSVPGATTSDSGVHSLDDAGQPGQPGQPGAERPQVVVAHPMGETQKEFIQAEPVPPRNMRAARNLLAQTLQMPLTVSPLPPPEQPPQPNQRRTTAQLHGWTSVQRIGGEASNEATGARPASARSTDPMSGLGAGRAGHAGNASQGSYGNQERQDPASRSAPPPLPGRSGRPNLSSAIPSPAGRSLDYDRTTIPNAHAVRVPELSAREWLFIGLLLCASAATLYSLLVDDVTPTSPEDLESSSAVEHVVTPATAADDTPGAQGPAGTPTSQPDKPAAAPAAAPASAAEPWRAPGSASPPSAAGTATPAAAAVQTTELVTDPPQAEVVLGGAVIGNTPARVARGAQSTDYLLRKPGFEPQVVRVSAQSPERISVTLHSRTPATDLSNLPAAK